MKKASRRTWKHRGQAARKARKTTNYMGADVTVYQSIDPSVTSKFVGYDKLVSRLKDHLF